MNDSRSSMFFWSAGLVVTGLLLLLFNFGLLERFEPLAQYIVAGIFVVAALGFFGGYLSNRTKWWRLIPGWTLLAVAGMVALSAAPGVSPLLIPALLFVGLGRRLRQHLPGQPAGELVGHYPRRVHAGVERCDRAEHGRG